MIQIENYISGFLLKNKYCAISGLGTLELKRDAAYLDSDDSRLEPPSYNITFVPIGVIDDAFPTYIANHENVSISKASNDIKTFSQDVKKELRKTGRYEVKGVGHFTYDNDRMQFHQDETLNLERDPIQLHREKRIVKEGDEETLADAKSFKDLHFTHPESGVAKPKMGSILKYLLGMLLIIGIAAACYFGYKYYQEHQVATDDSLNEQAVSMEEFSEELAEDTAIVVEGLDTTIDGNAVVNVDSGAIAPAAAHGEFRIAINNYVNQAAAQSQADKLSAWGNKTGVQQLGDKFHLVVYASHPQGDTVALKDSLRRYFNPSGKPFIVK